MSNIYILSMYFFLIYQANCVPTPLLKDTIVKFNGNTEYIAFNDICSRKVLGKLSQDVTIFNNFQLPPHDKLKIELIIFQEGQADQFHILGDGQELKTTSQVSKGSKNCFEINIKTDIIQHSNNEILISISKDVLIFKGERYWSLAYIQIFIEKKACSDCLLCQLDCRPWEQANIIPTIKNLFHCGNKDPIYQFLGGTFQSGQSIQLQANYLKPHSSILIKFTFVKLFQSLNKLKLQISIDDKELALYELDQIKSYYGFCIRGDQFQIILINKETKHQKDQLKVDIKILGEKIKYDQDSSEESEFGDDKFIQLNMDDVKWGIRNINVYIEKCSPSCGQCTGGSFSECLACEKGYKKFEDGCYPEKEKEQQPIKYEQDCNSPNRQGYIEYEQNFLPGFKIFFLEGWLISDQISNKLTIDCIIRNNYKIQLIGMFSQQNSALKQINLPPHSELEIYASFYFFGCQQNVLNVLLDQKLVQSIDLSQISFIQNNDDLKCNIDSKQLTIPQYDFGLLFKHTSQNLQIEFKLKTQENNKCIWGFNDFELDLHLPPCAKLFTQTNYKGQYVELCQNQNKLDQKLNDGQIKSIIVPKNFKVVLYSQADFGGRQFVFTKSIPNIEEIQ